MTMIHNQLDGSMTTYTVHHRAGRQKHDHDTHWQAVA